MDDLQLAVGPYGSWIRFDAGSAVVITLTDLTIWSAVFVLTAFALFALRRCRGGGTAERRGPSPPGPPAWPIVGNIFELGRRPHAALAALAGRYGDVFRVRLGRRPAVVVSGLAAVRTALQRRGDALAGRPDFAWYRHYAGGHSISFRSYTVGYVGHRRLVAQALQRLIADGAVDRIVGRETDRLVANWTAATAFDVVDDGGGVSGIDPTRDLILAVGGILYSVCFGADVLLIDDEEYCKVLLTHHPGTELFAVGNQVLDLVPSSFNRLLSMTLSSVIN